MSIILRALKKAEAATGRKATPSFKSASQGTKSKWPMVVVAVCTVLLGFFFAAYLLKGSKPAEISGPAPQAKPAPTAPSAVPAVAGASAINSNAITHIRAGRYKDAESLLKNAVLQYPNDPYLHNHLALALKKQGHLTEAAVEYEKAIELKPDYFIAMNNLAVTLEAMGQKERARELYEKVIEGAPAMGAAHLNYALFLEAQGKISEAENHYHTFLTLSKDKNLRGLVQRRLLALR